VAETCCRLGEPEHHRRLAIQAGSNEITQLGRCLVDGARIGWKVLAQHGRHQQVSPPGISANSHPDQIANRSSSAGVGDGDT
jgi:hypothetical protein